MILDSKNIKYDVIDITEPGKENVKDFMQNNATSNGATVSDPNPRSPLPPQLFNDDEYCGVSLHHFLPTFVVCSLICAQRQTDDLFVLAFHLSFVYAKLHS